MNRFNTIDQLEVTGRRVLVRVDLNVPMKDGRVTDTTRIDRTLPTLNDLIEKGARVILMSHFARPKGKVVPEMSIAPLVEPLQQALGGRSVALAPDCIGPKAQEAAEALADGQVLLLENLRFHAEEEANDAAFADALAKLGEAYVNDAFATSHRAHASVEALARRLPSAAGRLMQAELEHLGLALEAPTRPVMAIVGGAKISTKLDLLGNLIRKVDVLVVGGAMANTFLNALGFPVGASLCEHEMADTAREIVAAARNAGCDIVLPNDAVVAAELAEGVATQTVSVKDVPEDQKILDVGPATSEHISRRMAECRTLVWNGPLGCFEVAPFDQATNQVAQTAVHLTGDGALISVAGGGDTVAALSRAGVLDKFTYVSTAGGAFLEWLEGKTLPGVAALEAAAGE